MSTLIERLSDEADLCRNEGADDIARLLDEAAEALKPAKSTAQEREAFEAWARADTTLSLQRDGDGYADMTTGLLWHAWQARAALATAGESVRGGDTYEKPSHGWTCFHCGETFTTVGSARDHFGAAPTAEPGCLLKVSPGAERGLLMALRKTEETLARFMEEDSDTSRAMHALQGKHSAQLRTAEEAGYERGLRDAAPDRAEVLRQALGALQYHQEQTRPIARTQEAIDVLVKLLGGE